MAIKLPTELSTSFKAIHQLFILLYGQPKIGKTEFAHHAGQGKALYLALEPGQDFLPTFNLPVTNWQDFEQVCNALRAGRDLPYSSVVVDTVDILHKLCAEDILKKKNIEHEGDLAMGKGYNLVNRQFLHGIQTILATCRLRGWGCIFISHARDAIDGSGAIKPGLPTTSYNMLSAACDMILYMYAFQHKEKGTVRAFGTKPNGRFDAGDRTGCLPAVLELGKNGQETFQIFQDAYGKAIEAKKNQKG
jgi:hypothetical protein